MNNIILNIMYHILISSLFRHPPSSYRLVLPLEQPIINCPPLSPPSTSKTIMYSPGFSFIDISVRSPLPIYLNCSCFSSLLTFTYTIILPPFYFVFPKSQPSIQCILLLASSFSIVSFRVSIPPFPSFF